MMPCMLFGPCAVAYDLRVVSQRSHRNGPAAVPKTYLPLVSNKMDPLGIVRGVPMIGIGGARHI